MPDDYTGNTNNSDDLKATQKDIVSTSIKESIFA